MRLVVMDTSVLLPALLAPGGRRRQLLTVLAYSAVAAYHALIGRAEQEAMNAITAEIPGASTGGLPVETLIQNAGDARTILDEFMPAVTPTEFVMTACPLLFDEVEGKILERGHIWGASPDDAKTYRRALLAVTPFIVPPYSAGDVRDYGLGDPDDNFLIHSAIEAQAEFVISDDKKVAPDGGSVKIECPLTGRTVTAIQVNDFVEDYLNNSNFDLSAVSGAGLPLALRAMLVGAP
ncbi:hypothetical protein [Miltoncostaea marina]|uniref:hypothetical protein n=1 Tax=Miltoncostaea marina TaxID=2843215 RepID=UPI001C3D6E0C|nr:hypothetical protein [Miltoncostaea marina]